MVRILFSGCQLASGESAGAYFVRLAACQIANLTAREFDHICRVAELDRLGIWLCAYFCRLSASRQECRLQGAAKQRSHTTPSHIVSFIHRDEAFRMQFGFRIFAQFCSGVCVIWKVNTTGRSSFIISHAVFLVLFPCYQITKCWSSFDLYKYVWFFLQKQLSCWISRIIIWDLGHICWITL